MQEKLNTELKQMDYEVLLEEDKQGNPNAAYWIGQAFQNGTNGVSVNYLEALKYYNKSAKQGDARAYFQIGNMYRDGIGIEKDMTIAIENWKVANKAGILLAGQNIGYSYLNGEGVAQNTALAIQYLQEGAEKNVLVSCYLLAKIYFEGKDVSQDMERGVYYLKKCENIGAFHPSDYLLGQFYFKGLYENGQCFFEKNVIKGIEYLKRAEAYDMLGDIYSRGEGIPKDINMAINYYKKAIESGDYIAAYKIPPLHLCDDFRNASWRNTEEGIYWAKVALEHSALPDMNIYVAGLLRYYYDSFLSEYGDDEKAEYIINGYEYLFSQKRCFSKVSIEKQGEAEELLFKVATMLLGFYLNMGKQDIFLALLKQLEAFEIEVPRFAQVSRVSQGYGYHYLGEKILDENNLDIAKQCFEKAQELGYKESAEYLARFKTTLFGKLVFN